MYLVYPYYAYLRTSIEQKYSTRTAISVPAVSPAIASRSNESVLCEYAVSLSEMGLKDATESNAMREAARGNRAPRFQGPCFYRLDPPHFFRSANRDGTRQDVRLQYSCSQAVRRSASSRSHCPDFRHHCSHGGRSRGTASSISTHKQLMY